MRDITVKIALFKNPKILLYQDALKKSIELGQSDLFIFEILKLKHLSEEVIECLFRREESPEIIRLILFHNSTPKRIKEPFMFFYKETENKPLSELNELEKIVLKLVKNAVC